MNFSLFFKKFCRKITSSIIKWSSSLVWITIDHLQQGWKNSSWPLKPKPIIRGWRSHVFPLYSSRSTTSGDPTGTGNTFDLGIRGGWWDYLVLSLRTKSWLHFLASDWSSDRFLRNRTQGRTQPLYSWSVGSYTLLTHIIQILRTAPPSGKILTRNWCTILISYLQTDFTWRGTWTN